MYTVFGYNDLRIDFKFKFNRFTDAIKTYRKLNKKFIVFVMRENPKTCSYII